MIELCRRRFGQRSRAHFIVGDATELKFPDCSFDAVTCLGVIEKVQAYDAAVNEMVRVLKPGGTLLIAFPNQLSPYGAWRRWIFCPAVALLRPFYFRLTGRPRTPTLYGKGARSWLSLKEFEYPHGAISLMERHGADVTGLAYYDPSLLLSPLDELFPRVAVSVTKRMERSWNEKLQWLGSGFMLKGLKV
jgi:SAM-dependent methyltransferase